MIPDRGRTAVYEAESTAFDGTSHETLVGFERLVSMCRAVTSAVWWPVGEVHIVRARSDARSSSARLHHDAPPVIRIAAPQMTPATLVHELAHVLAGLAAGHGPLFRRAHVDLTRSVLGDEPCRWLCQAYTAMGLTTAHRRWPAPPRETTDGAPFAL